MTGYREVMELMEQVEQEVKNLPLEDPRLLPALLFKLIEERREMNKLLREINRKLEEIRAHLSIPPEEPKEMLSDVEHRILEIVERKGRVTAEEVARELGYKGRNGASARLNSLYQRGFLKKARAGRKVYYFL